MYCTYISHTHTEHSNATYFLSVWIFDMADPVAIFPMKKEKPSENSRDFLLEISIIKGWFLQTMICGAQYVQLSVTSTETLTKSLGIKIFIRTLLSVQFFPGNSFAKLTKRGKKQNIVEILNLQEPLKGIDSRN